MRHLPDIKSIAKQQHPRCRCYFQDGAGRVAFRQGKSYVWYMYSYKVSTYLRTGSTKNLGCGTMKHPIEKG